MVGGKAMDPERKTGKNLLRRRPAWNTMPVLEAPRRVAGPLIRFPWRYEKQVVLAIRWIGIMPRPDEHGWKLPGGGIA